MSNPNHPTFQKHGWTYQGETSGFHKYTHSSYPNARFYSTSEGHWQHWGIENKNVRLLHEGITTNLQKHLEKLV